MKKVVEILNNYKITVLVIILLFAAKFLGFIKNIFLARFYGTNVISDAYQMAISIPMIVIGIVLYSYQAFTKGYYESEKNGRSSEYTCSFLNFILLILLFISIILLVFSNNIINLFAPGFNSEQLYYTSKLISPITIGTIFLAIANILAEYLRCKNSYVLSQISYLVINIIEIFTIFVAFYFDYRWLSYGYLVANFVYFIILLVLCIKKNFTYHLLICKSDIKIFSKILIPVFISSIVTDVNSMIDKMFASNSGTGIVSTLSYSTNIKTVSLILAAGFLTVLFPKISKKCVEGQYEVFNHMIYKGLLTIIMIYIPISLLSIFFSKYIVKLVYFRGAFDFDALIKTSNCLKMYIIGITGISIRDLYIKALYCLEKGNLVIIISVLSVMANVLLNALLFERLGYIGLPLATSLSVWIVIPILIFFYKSNIRKKIRKGEK